MRLRRGWIIVGVAAVVVAGVVVSRWRLDAAQQAFPGETVSLVDGRVTLQVPQGWRRVACPGGASGCVYLRTPHSNDNAIAVIVVTPGQIRTPSPADVVVAAIDPATVPGRRSFTVDEARFTRVHFDAVTTPAAQPATTSVTGALSDGTKVFITCVEKIEPDLVRAGCETAIGSLHVRQ